MDIWISFLFKNKQINWYYKCSYIQIQGRSVYSWGPGIHAGIPQYLVRPILRDAGTSNCQGAAEPLQVPISTWRLQQSRGPGQDHGLVGWLRGRCRGRWYRYVQILSFHNIILGFVHQAFHLTFSLSQYLKNPFRYELELVASMNSHRKTIQLLFK